MVISLFRPDRYFTFDFVHWCFRWMSAGKVTQHDLSIKLSGMARHGEKES